MARFMRTDLGLAHSRLNPPEVVGAGIAFSGPGTRLADPADPLDYARRGRASWNLAPPVVVNAAPIFFGPAVALATRGTVSDDLHRRAPFSKLRGPVVVFAAPLAAPTDVHLVPSRRGRPKSFLYAPTVVFPSVTAFTAPPIKTTLAVRANTRSFQSRRPLSGLGKPLVVFAPTSITIGAPGVVLVSTRPRSPSVRSVLRPPTVVASSGVFFGPGTHLVRARGVRTFSRIFAPVLPPLASPIAVRLAASRRGIPKSHLFAPVVVGGGIYFYPVKIKLAPSTRGKTRSRLTPPAVVGNGIVFAPIATTLSPASRGKPSSRLFPPVIPPLARPVDAELSVQLVRASVIERQPHSRLSPPAVVGNGVYFAPVGVHLAPSRRGTPKSRLVPPTVVGQTPFRPALTHLTTSRRGVAKSALRAPVLPPLAAPVVEKLAVQLTRTEALQRQTRSHLAPPAVVGTGTTFRPVQVELAASRRGRPLSRLSPPAVVGAGVYFYPVHVTLAASRRLVAKSVLRQPVLPPLARPEITKLVVQLVTAELRPRQPHSTLRLPAVVGAGITFAPLAVTLSPSTRGKPSSDLRAPAVVGNGVYFYPVKVVLAASRRGKPFSRLTAPILTPSPRPVDVEIAVQLVRAGVVERQPHSRLASPAVVGAGIYFYPIKVRLAPSTDIQRRRRTVADLKPPTVVQAVGVILPPEIAWLAPSTRGQAKSHLFPPSVVGAGRVFRAIDVTLVFGRAGKPKSRLTPPAVVGIAPFRSVKVTLAVGRFGKPRSVLGAPIIPLLARPVRVALVPQPDNGRRRQARNILRAPIVVRAAFIANPVALTLASSARGKAVSKLSQPITFPALARPLLVVLTRITTEKRGPHSHLRPPTVVGAQPFAPVRARLAASRRGLPKSRLFAPAVVRVQPFAPIRVFLAPSKHGAPKGRLSPPAVLGTPPFAPVVVTLAPQARGRTESRLSSPTAVTIVPPTLAQQTLLVRLVAVAARVALIRRKPRFVLAPPSGGRGLKLSASFPVSAWSTGSMSAAMEADTPGESMTTGEPTAAFDGDEPETGWSAGEPF